MNFRSTYILMGTAVALLIGMSLYVLLSDDKPTGEGYLLPSFQAASYKVANVNGLEIERGGEKLVFVREDAHRWKMIAPIEARADAATIDAIIRQALEARKITKGIDLTTNLNTHGLDKPAVKLTFKKDDKTTTVSLGKVTLGDPSQSVMYVLTPESPKPQAIRRDSLRALFKPDAKFGANVDLASVVRWADDFRQMRLLGAELEQDPTLNTLEVRLTQGKKRLDLSRDNPDKVWRFKYPEGYGDAETDPAPGANPEKITSVRELLNRVVSIQVAEAKHFIEKPGDLTKLGLDPSSNDVLQVELIREGGATETLYLGKQIEGEPDKVYAQYKGDSYAAMVNGTAPRALLMVLNDPIALRDKTFLKFRPERIDAIDVDIAGSKFDLRQVPGFPITWKVYSPDGSVAGAGPQAIDNLLKQLTQPNIVQAFPPAGTKDDVMGFDKPAVELKIWDKGILPAEEKADPNAKPKVKEQPSYRVVFGKPAVNPAQVYARRWIGDAKADVQIPVAVLTAASKPRVEYVEASLKSFAPDQVAKITFSRGGESWEIARAETETKPAAQSEWKINAPESKKGKTADVAKVMRIIGDLANLKAIKVTADKPSPEQLQTLKLDGAMPRVKIALKLQNEPTERIYYLGDDAGSDKQNIFAKTSDSPIVFEVSRGVYDDTQTGELQDMVIYRVDAAKLKGLKLKGWADILDDPATRELEMKDKAWVFKSDPSRPIDLGKVNTFLSDVVAPKADAIIPGGVKPEYKLDPKVGAMEIELDTGDGKPITLTLGAVAPDGIHVYATSNQAPGEVFTLLKDRFKTIREKPSVFKKE